MYCKLRLLSLMVTAALGACIVGDGDGVGDDAFEADTLASTEQAVEVLNGVNLNGVNLNGVNLNGVNLNGVNLNGVSLNGVTLDGVAATSVGAGANGLTMVKSGVTYSGASVVGAKLNGTLSNGSTLPLRISAAVLLTGNVWSYRVEALSAGTTWTNVCGVGVAAIAIAGRWDYRSNITGAGGWIADATSVTFGCRGFAIAKCVEWGYAPWKTTTAGVLLRDHHEACVRMVRGDYCGNGFAWTADGTAINIYDALGIQTDAKAWPVDAEWTKTGAKCLDKLRKFATADTACLIALRNKTTCGTFGTGVLLIDEYKPL